MIPGKDSLYLAGMLAWIVMLVCAILNGAFREIVLAPQIGSAAQPLSGVTGAAIFTLITYMMLKWLGKPYSSRELLTLGVFWLLFIIVFEFTFGRYVMGKEWGDLLAAYDLRTGNLWSLLLLYTAFLPLLVSRWFKG